MDNTTSAVDSETELYIQDQLRRLPFDCTRFIIAQRISSMRDADLIAPDLKCIVELLENYPR